MNNFTHLIEKIARCSNLYRNNRLESHGIPGNQSGYIIHVCNNPGVSQDTIAKKMFINKSNVARQLAVLEQNGYITRCPDPEDKRILMVFPTQKAIDVYPDIKQVLDEWNDKLLDELSPPQQQELKGLLHTVKTAAM